MQIIRSPADAAAIADAELRHLIEKTIAALSEDCAYDPDVLAFSLIVEPGDSLNTINAQLGFDILVNKWTGIRFDQPGYTQSFEILDEHAAAECFELVFLTDDSGAGIEVFVPRTADIDPDLLAMCRRFAVPGTL